MAGHTKAVSALAAIFALALSFILAYRPWYARAAAHNALDRRIEAGLRLRLARDPNLAAVSASSFNAVVTLTGPVSSYRFFLEADHAAHQIPDVQGVIDALVVTGPQVPDPILRRQLTARLATATSKCLRPAAVTVDNVQNGVVTLTGATETYADRDVVLTSVADLAGIKGMVDEIAVHNPASPPIP